MENVLKVIAVIALLVLAAMLATPKGRLPLALRGINKLLRRDGASANQSSVVAPTWKRLKKPTKEQEAEFQERLSDENLTWKDKLAMVLGAYITILLPCILILLAIGLLSMLLFGLL